MILQVAPVKAPARRAVRNITICWDNRGNLSKNCGKPTGCKSADDFAEPEPHIAGVVEHCEPSSGFDSSQLPGRELAPPRKRSTARGIGYA
jgi:hypothetical protein